MVMEEHASNSKAFDMFYNMLNEIRASNRRDPKAASKMVHDGERLQTILAPLQTLDIPFSGEEEFGRYLDLHEFYNMFVNSKFGFPLTYIEYLDIFPAVDDETIIPLKYKGTQQYKEYVTRVLDYLVSFVNRAEPLMFLDRLFKDIELEFEEGAVGRKRPRTTCTSDVMELKELEGYNTLESLMELGCDRLKQALDCLGLKSGGTIQQKAERLLLVKNTPLDQLHPTHFKNKKEKAMLLVEAKVRKLCELLRERLERTRQHVKNKQGMTAREIEQDRSPYDDHDCDSDSEGEENEKKVYNYAKIPLGYDGKPIPYWLYKLHGLEHEYTCEICGNSTYKGRRAFEQHFHQQRHQHGMRCLGIPNTKIFNEITSINDAKNLWRHIQLKQESSQWNPDLYEEYEDAEGNIYPKRTYTDLLKQGLV